MKIKQMSEFQEICKKSLVDSYKAILGKDITLDNTFIVWSVKVLQNFKALASTNIDGDNVYVEYTYNGDKEELYEDFYIKKRNKVLKNT